MKNTRIMVSLAVTVGLSGCSFTHSHAAAPVTKVVASPSASPQVTFNGTPQSQWPTSAPSTELASPNAGGSSPTSFAHHPNSAQTGLPAAFITAFLHTDGVSQDAWAKTMIAMTQPQFGGRLAIQGLERLPHHQHVTGPAKLLWVNPDQPEAQWFVPTSNGGYTLTEDLSDPKGKIADMTAGQPHSTATDPD